MKFQHAYHNNKGKCFDYCFCKLGRGGDMSTVFIGSLFLREEKVHSERSYPIKSLSFKMKASYFHIKEVWCQSYSQEDRYGLQTCIQHHKQNGQKLHNIVKQFLCILISCKSQWVKHGALGNFSTESVFEDFYKL